VQAQRLLDPPLEQGELAQPLVAELVAGGEDLLELGQHPARVVGMAQELDHGPGRGHRAGVVSGEHRRQQHAGDLVGRERRAVLVASLDQRLQEVLAAVAAGPPLRDDAADHLLQPDAGPVAPPERRDREIGIEIADRMDAALEIVVDRRELLGELVAELGAEQAVRRGEVGELGAVGDEVDGPLVAELLQGAVDLAGDDLAVGPHAAVLERGQEHAELLRRALGGRVVDDALAEDRRHHLVGLVRAELLIGSAEEGLVGRRSGEQEELLVDQLEAGHLAALAAGPVEERDGVASELERVAEDGQRSGQHRRRPRAPGSGRPALRRDRGHHRHPPRRVIAVLQIEWQIIEALSTSGPCCRGAGCRSCLPP
jgi:hypothetical protein